MKTKKDIGSGLGGPARVLAELNPNVSVVACEYQSDLNAKAKYLTDRCSLTHRVSHVQSDFLETSYENEFDGIMSMLAFLHIPNKQKLFKKCIHSLKSGGKIFVEDYIKTGELTKARFKVLNKHLTHPRPQTTSNSRKTGNS